MSCISCRSVTGHTPMCPRRNTPDYDYALPYASQQYPTAARTLFWGIDLLIAAHKEGEVKYQGKSVYRFEKLVFHVIENNGDVHFHNDELLPFIKLSVQMGDRFPIVDIPASRFSEGGVVIQTDTLVTGQETILTIHNTFDKPLRVVGYFEGVVAQ